MRNPPSQILSPGSGDGPPPIAPPAFELPDKIQDRTKSTARLLFAPVFTPVFRLILRGRSPAVFLRSYYKGGYKKTACDATME